MEDLAETDLRSGSDIAVIGMACRFPGARDTGEFWRVLSDGLETVSFFAESELERSILDSGVESHPAFVRAAPVLEGADLFDAAFFDVSPREAEVMDPQQRVFLECAWHALENAGYDPESYPGLIGVFAGASTDTYVFNLFSNRGGLAASFDSFQVGLGNDLAFLANRVSHKLDLRGPSLSVHTACSTSLVAVHLARQSLLIDECQIALAGAVSVRVPQRTGHLYTQGSVLSPDGHCRPFDARARGTLFGSGVGIVVLKRLAEALADGDSVHAVIKGSAVNNDGALKASFTAPGVHGQSEVVLEALADAGVDPGTISYVEAHGTGTQLGDPIEILALSRAFRCHTDRKGFCALGSVKSNFGHLDSAAGMPGLIKTVLALEHGQLPPSLHFETPNPELELDETPFYVQRELAEWPAGDRPRRAGVSSFGVGGTNAHVVLEEAPRLPAGRSREALRLVALSARSEAALESATSNLIDHLRAHPGLDLADVAFTLQAGRKAFPFRRAAVCRDLAEAVARLEALDPQHVATGWSEIGDRAAVFLFPGGGAQHVGMGRELYASSDEFRRGLDTCAEALLPRLGLDLRDLVHPAAGEEDAAARRLEQCRFGLPALFAVEYALARAWIDLGIRPRALMGHSLGEYVAACLAGVFSLEDALTLVEARGRLLSGLPPGAMLSVPLPEAEVAGLLAEEGLALAAVNGPAHCVVSGASDAIGRLAERLAARGIESRRLRIEAAGHSSLVEPILGELGAILRGLRLHPPSIPCMSNTTGTWLRPEEATDPDYWVRHLRRTVRFADGLRELLSDPAFVLLEVGPGRILTTLARAQAGEARSRDIVASMRHPDDRRSDEAFLLNALAGLWVAGVPVEWQRLHRGERPRRIPLPGYPFERERYWIEPGIEAGRPAAGSAPSGKAADLADWFHLPAWKPSVPPPRAGAATGRWLLFLDDGGLGETMAGRLRQDGLEVATVAAGGSFARIDDQRYTVRSGSDADHAALVEDLRARDRLPQCVVHLWSLSALRDGGAEAFDEAQRRGYYSLLFLARALAGARVAAPVRITMVSSHLQDVSGEEPLCPEKAPLLGACLVISQEHEGLRCRSVDLSLPADGWDGEQAEALIAEAAADVPHPVVAYRSGRRWVQSWEPVRLEGDATPARPLRERGVYLLTGGLGAVSLLLGDWLARSFRARLALVGRASFPRREEWDAWEAGHPESDRVCQAIRRFRAWEELGAEVLVDTADVADAGQLRACVARVRERFGALDGVLHTAAVTSGPSLYRPFTEMGREESEAQFHPKARGAYALEEALAGERPDFCLLFSSNAAVLGGLGYVTYAAANAFLNAFAASRSRTTGFPWLSANWDGWPEETRKYAGVQTSMDQYTMTSDEAAEAFRRVVCLAPAGAVAVPTGDLPARLALWVLRTAPDRGRSAQHPRPELKSSYLAPSTGTERTIAGIWQDVLGIEQVGVQDNFFDLGGHSLLATRLVARLNDVFRLDFPLGRFFEAPTVAGCAGIVDELQASAGQVDEKLAILQLLEELSEEEVTAELGRLGLEELHP